jgi:RNA polymerase sigma-70 factor (ECF subfamily)
MVVRQAIAGSAAAQEHLFGRLRPRLYRIALGILRNKEDAEDALQDGLYKAYSRLQSFQGRSAFSTWLTRIVINSALMARRNNRYRREACLEEMLGSESGSLPYDIVDSRPNPERLYAATEINTLIEKHIFRLQPTLRAAFRLHAINRLPGPHSSRVLGISANAFKSRIFRARGKLASELQSLLENGYRARERRMIIWAE